MEGLIFVSFVGFSVWFYFKNKYYPQLSHEIFICCWAIYLMMLLKNWNTAHIIWMAFVVWMISAFMEGFSPKNTEKATVIGVGLLFALIL
tara:strand:- start:244 stop:513 length:270 start_codon:yes stop_codon:yes gene_type:complete